MREKKLALPSAGAILLILASLYGIYLVHEVLIPFVLSFALAYLVNPVIHLFEARGLKRDQIVTAIYLFIAVAITLTANALIPVVSQELSLLQSKAPAYLGALKQAAAHMQEEAATRLPYGRMIVDKLSLKMYDPIMHQLPNVPTYLLGIVPLLSMLFLVPFITFFLLLDADRMLQKAIQLCPSRYVEQVLHLISEVDTSLGNYIRGVLIIALAIAIASFVGLWALRIDYALAVATISGVSSFVPYLGAIMGALIGALLAFFQFHNLAAPLKVVALFFGIRLADEALLQPLISKHSVHLHPLIFLLALILGGKIFGFIGLLFAVPCACILKALLRVGWEWYASERQLTSVGAPADAVPYV